MQKLTGNLQVQMKTLHGTYTPNSRTLAFDTHILPKLKTSHTHVLTIRIDFQGRETVRHGYRNPRVFILSPNGPNLGGFLALFGFCWVGPTVTVTVTGNDGRLHEISWKPFLVSADPI